MRWLVLFALVLGCASQPREIADVLAAHRSSERYVAPPSSLTPRPWQVGQWALHEVLAPGLHGYLRTSVVAKDACGFWLETVAVFGSYADRTITKLCFRGELDPALDLAQQMQLLQAFMTRRRDRTIVIDLRDGKNPNTRAWLQEILATLGIVLWHSPPGEERSKIVVPAGQFAGAVRTVARVSVEGSLQTVTSWFHPDVPFAGTLESTSSDAATLTLLDYGLSGAKSQLPGFDEHLASTSLQ